MSNREEEEEQKNPIAAGISFSLRIHLTRGFLSLILSALKGFYLSKNSRGRHQIVIVTRNAIFNSHLQKREKNQLMPCQ